MTREETIKVLSILKVAYPNFYRGLTKQEANAVIDLWAMQFSDVPGDVVCIAINKLIATNTFPPAIAEVKSKLKDMYAEAVTTLLDYDGDETNAKALCDIVKYCREIKHEPSITALISDRRVARIDETHDKQSGNMSLLQT